MLTFGNAVGVDLAALGTPLTSLSGLVAAQDTLSPGTSASIQSTLWWWTLTPTVLAVCMLAVVAARLWTTNRRLRTKQSRALHDSKEVCDAMLRAATDPVTVVDTAGRVIVCNEAVGAVFGRAPAELIGLGAEDLVPPATAAEMRSTVDTVVTECRPVQFENWVEQHRFEHSLCPITDAAGVVQQVAIFSRDTTDRYRRSVALRESEARLRAALEATSDGLWEMDVRADRTVLSPRYTELLGFGQKKLVQTFAEWQAHVHPDDLPRAMSAFEAHVRGETPSFHVEYRARKESGEWVWLLSHGKITERDSDGSPLRIIGTDSDITRRKHAEQLLRLQGDISAALSAVDSLEDAFAALLRNACRIEGIDCGRAYLRSPRTDDLLLIGDLGLSPEFCVSVRCVPAGTPRWEIGTASRPRYRSARDISPGDEDIRREGLRAHAVLPIPFEGRVVACLNLASRSLDDIPEITRNALEAIASNVGSAIARIQTRLALQASEELFRTLTETIPVGVTILTRGGLQFANRTAAELTGCTPEEFVASKTWSLIHPDDRDAVRERFEAQMAGDDARQRFEFRALRKDGDVRWLDFSTAVIEHQGEPAALGAALDVTARKRAEALAREHQAQLMHVARVSTVGELATGLAHQLASPLSSIIYYARGSAAQLRDESWNRDEAVRTLLKIAEQAEHAGETIRHIKTFVRRARPQRTLTNLNDVIKSACELTTFAIREQEVDLQLDLAPDLPTTVVDAVQIEQVLLNLIRNGIDALQAVPPGERSVTIRSSAPQPAIVCIEVLDNGKPLPPDAFEHVFDSFFTTKSAGLGMGLPISRFIIEAHGGELWGRPRTGRGAEFGFTFPVGQGDPDGAR